PRAEVRPAPAPVIPAPRAPAAPEPASTETFRRDLLQLVSARTGYPVEALDETLPLEAGLGIDSIKTVEIFSSLKDYHACFRTEEQEEEELLSEFTKLKTLRDIIDLYDRRRTASLAPATNANGKGHPHPDGRPGAAVERHVVLPVEAPLEAGGQKKNALKAIP